MTQENTALLEALEQGYKRAWKYCAQHNRYGYYDYVPYSLSNPISVMPCGCDTKGCKTVPEDEAIAALSSPTQSSGEAEVTQADRDAAAKAARETDYTEVCISRIKQGLYDHYPFVQAFKDHRLAATPTTDSLTADAAAWRVDDLTAKGEVCDSFVIFTDYENVEEHVRKYGARHTKVTPLYPPAALPLPAQTVPADVAALVVAAREASSAFTGLFEDSSEADALDALDKSLQPFASRVCWDDEGGSLPDAHAVPCTCALAQPKGGES